MKIGLSFFPVRTEIIVPVVLKADELGYDSVWLGEHLVFPSKVESKYPYNPEAGAPLPSTPLFDPLLTHAYLAGQTKQIRFGTGIYVLPLRHPVNVAKYAATLDALSGGRLLLGIGAGWLKEEFDTVDMPWEKRGTRMEECVEVMRKLWREPLAEHHGTFYDFAETGFEPKPARGSVPILVGGETPRALKRAARIGDGWYGMHHTPESAADRVRQLAEFRESETPLEITVACKEVPTADLLERYRDAGVDRVVFDNRLLSGGVKSLDACLDGVERFAGEVMSPAAGG